MKHLSSFITLISLFLLLSCVVKQMDERIVSVTIEPQRYFAEQIAGDKFAINCVVPSGQSPETYDPTPQQMVQVGKSLAYLQIGYIGFEQAWMESIRQNNPKMEVFNLSDGINLLKNAEDGKAHSHGEGEVCNHHHPGGIDPHTWNSFAGARVIARNTLAAFVALDPENEAYYTANYNTLLEEIEQTERTVASMLEPLSSRTFIIYHPALTYFANEFGLTQLCIEMDGKEPSPAQLKELVETARNHNTQVVFIQQEFDQKNAELIAKETGCRLVRINPLDYDWNKEMIHIAKSLADGEAD